MPDLRTHRAARGSIRGLASALVAVAMALAGCGWKPHPCEGHGGIKSRTYHGVIICKDGTKT